MKKKILLISYWINKQGNSPGIMADDKIINFKKLGYKIIVISSADSSKIKDKDVVHYRVPSLNFYNFFKEHENKKFLEKISSFIFLPVVLTLGIIFDLLEYFLLKGRGGGKWLWAISATITSIIINCCQKVDIIFTTGGPASAHLAGVISNLFFKKRLYVELQDPLFGKDIGRSAISAKYLKMLEKFILKYCHRLIFVTKTAAEEAKYRNSNFHYKIYGIYTGTTKLWQNNKITESNKKKIIFTHLGTLYASRNFKNLIIAIRYLLNQNLLSQNNIKVLNLGDVYGVSQKKMLEKNYIKWIKSINRIDALKKCSDSDVLLLIQHTDDRSKLTFPYKVYDYLNYNKIIFGLLNNTELERLLTKRGHICSNVNDPKDISKKLNYLLNNKKKILNTINKKKNIFDIDPKEQCKKIFTDI